MDLEVLNIEGKSTGRKVSLSDEIFGIEPNEHIVYLAVKHHLANRRQGTSKTKERGEIKGSTRKIKKQKGTGTARAGSIKNPLFRGGGRVFGPKPRDYNSKLNKKENLLARKSVLSAKAKNGNIVIVENFEFESPKTKSFSEIVSGLGLDNGKSLFVLNGVSKNVSLSSRNIQDSKVSNVNSLSTYDMMRADKLILEEEAVKIINEMLNN